MTIIKISVVYRYVFFLNSYNEQFNLSFYFSLSQTQIYLNVHVKEILTLLKIQENVYSIFCVIEIIL